MAFATTDVPTALYGYITEAPTHPPKPRIGWRFQGTNADGDTHVFDGHQSGCHEWDLIAVHD